MDYNTSGFPVLHYLPELAQTHVHWIDDAIQPSQPLLPPLLLLPSIFPSIRVFPSESTLFIRWPKYWSFSLSISLSNEYSGLISLRIDWFDLLAVQGTLKSLLQYHSSKASVFRHSAFFMVQLSRPYLATRKRLPKSHRLSGVWVAMCDNTVKNMEFEDRLKFKSWLETAMAPHSSTLAWKIPWTEEPGRLQSMGSQRVGHDWATSLSLFTFIHWRRKWQPTPVFLPGESQGRGSLVGCRLRGRTESDTTEVT